MKEDDDDGYLFTQSQLVSALGHLEGKTHVTIKRAA